MYQVKIRTSDSKWAASNGSAATLETADAGIRWYLVTINVETIERLTFAGADMIRFILPSAPRDYPSVAAMFPARYLVSESA